MTAQTSSAIKMSVCYPALSGYLAERRPAPEPAERGFVHVMGQAANRLTTKELHDQRGPFAMQSDFANAGPWLLKSIGLFAKLNDLHNLGIAVRNFLRTLHAADAPTQTRLRQAWQDAGLDRLANLEDLERQFREQPGATEP